mmetsp:Transcript_18900/g.38486  ORF Transcript_18900/g.38486 Transcript_18900/m.38486 type:complete len:322 (-) Transcript_18900:864-1829(-)
MWGPLAANGCDCLRQIGHAPLPDRSMSAAHSVQQQAWPQRNLVERGALSQMIQLRSSSRAGAATLDSGTPAAPCGSCAIRAPPTGVGVSASSPGEPGAAGVAAAAGVVGAAGVARRASRRRMASGMGKRSSLKTGIVRSHTIAAISAATAVGQCPSKRLDHSSGCCVCRNIKLHLASKPTAGRPVRLIRSVTPNAKPSVASLCCRPLTTRLSTKPGVPRTVLVERCVAWAGEGKKAGCGASVVCPVRGSSTLATPTSESHARNGAGAGTGLLLGQRASSVAAAPVSEGGTLVGSERRESRIFDGLTSRCKMRGLRSYGVCR